MNANHLESAAQRAAELLVKQLGGRPRIGVVMGSGWGHAVADLGQPECRIPMTSLPGFTTPTVEGHAGVISSTTIGGAPVPIFQGRRHRYEFEGDDYACMDAIVYNVQVAQAAGCEIIILTNAVGSVNLSYRVGQAIVIGDHCGIISAAPSPLRGGPTKNFLNCNELYDAQLRHLACYIDAPTGDEVLSEGVYAQVRGPHFETPADMRFLRRNEIDIVGMSIIQETIMAVSLGMQVLGISLVTDQAGDPVSHEVVQAVVKERAPYLGQLLRRIIEQL